MDYLLERGETEIETQRQKQISWTFWRKKKVMI